MEFLIFPLPPNLLHSQSPPSQMIASPSFHVLMSRAWRHARILWLSHCTANLSGNTTELAFRIPPLLTSSIATTLVTVIFSLDYSNSLPMGSVLVGAFAACCSLGLGCLFFRYLHGSVAVSFISLMSFLLRRHLLSVAHPAHTSENCNIFPSLIHRWHSLSPLFDSVLFKCLAPSYILDMNSSVIFIFILSLPQLGELPIMGPCAGHSCPCAHPDSQRGCHAQVDNE